MITLNNIEKVYQTSTIETLALNNINIDIKKGEFVSIMGLSGCGKSTLLNIMGLLDEPTKGDISSIKSMLNNIQTKLWRAFAIKKLALFFKVSI
jgi:putative ABC transport system ATP-binding protein